MEKDKKVSFDVFPEPHAGDEELLVVVNQGASDFSRVRRRSRAVSKVSMGSEAEEETEDQSIGRTESSVSTKEYRYSTMCTLGQWMTGCIYYQVGVTFGLSFKFRQWIDAI